MWRQHWIWTATRLPWALWCHHLHSNSVSFIPIMCHLNFNFVPSMLHSDGLVLVPLLGSENRIFFCGDLISIEMVEMPFKVLWRHTHIRLPYVCLRASGGCWDHEVTNRSMIRSSEYCRLCSPTCTPNPHLVSIVPVFHHSQYKNSFYSVWSPPVFHHKHSKIPPTICGVPPHQ